MDEKGYVYVGCQTRSTDIPTTAGAHDRTHNGGVDWYIARFLPDGSNIVYGTYIGDEGNNWLNTHNLVVDSEGNDAGRAGCIGNDGSMIIAGASSGKNWPIKNAFQSLSKGPGDTIVAKLSPTSRK